MENARRIKDLYDCVAIISDEELYPLQKWYNQLIDKTIDEIAVKDVLRMIRQKQFINLAMSKAIIFLQENVFIGESYDGELLYKISEMDSSFLMLYAGDLKKITRDALEKSVLHEWSYEGEENEFREGVSNMVKKLE